MSKQRKYHTKADIEKFFSEAAYYCVKIGEEKTESGYIKYHWRSRRSAAYHNKVFKHVAVFLLAQRDDFYLLDSLDIDNINGDKTDNRLENLRLLTPHVNLIKAMTSGHPVFHSKMKATMNRPEVKDSTIRTKRSKSVLGRTKTKS
jgi:hypothetical protein